MASIEVFFGVIIFLFALIGLARGFLKELGVTMVVMFILFFFSMFEPQLNRGLTKVMTMGKRFLPVKNVELFKCWLYIFVIGATAFVSYQGETLAFGGQAPKGAQGILLGFLTGTLNGYLIIGSIWYYMHEFHYPIAFLGFSLDKLSKFASGAIQFLPISFLGRPILFGQSLLLYLSLALILARVIR